MLFMRCGDAASEHNLVIVQDDESDFHFCRLNEANLEILTGPERTWKHRENILLAVPMHLFSLLERESENQQVQPQIMTVHGQIRHGFPTPSSAGRAIGWRGTQDCRNGRHSTPSAA